MLTFAPRVCGPLLCAAPGAGSWGVPYPSGTLTCVALGDHPAARDIFTAAHLLTRSTAKAKILEDPNGLVHCSVQWVVDLG